MPLSSASLNAACQFAFTVPGTDWAPIKQGNNQVEFGGTIAPATWDDAYAAVLPIAGGANTTIDLTTFTNLAGEAVTLTKVLAIVVKAAPAVAASPAIAVTVGPGASNGLQWLAGSGNVTLGANDSFTKMGDPTGTGFVVDATHKTLKFANTGTDAAAVTVVIIGTTL